MVQFYREPNGDYMAVDWESRYGDNYSCRAAAIEGLVTSISTCGAVKLYIAKCTEVLKSEVPAEWLEAIGE